MRHGIFKQYGVGHRQFVWNARDEDAIVSFFEQHWGCKDLLVSYDGACMIRPTKHAPATGWPHVDQAPVLKIAENGGKAVERRDFNCLQGLLNLRECGPLDGGLTVFVGSHRRHQQYFEGKGEVPEDLRGATPTLKRSKRGKKGEKGAAAAAAPRWADYSKNFYMFDPDNDEHDREFLAQFEKVKVCCKAGEFIVWNSKLIHYAAPIDARANPDPAAHRMCIYVSMLPRKYATAAELRKREEYLRTMRTTSHWACISLRVNGESFQTWGNQQIIDNFATPTDPPVLTARMKRLAGVSQSFAFDRQPQAAAASAAPATRRTRQTVLTELPQTSRKRKRPNESDDEERADCVDLTGSDGNDGSSDEGF